MPSQTGHHGGSRELYPNQGFMQNKGATENVLSCLQALFKIIISICFCCELLFLCTTAFMLTHAFGEMQTGVCKLTNPAIIWDMSSVVNSETIGLCPCSSAEQLPMKWMNICIPQGHLNFENYCSPDPLGRPSPSRANVKVVVMVLAIIGGIGLAGRMLYKRWLAFTEADINRGLTRGPAVARRTDPTFQILPSIDNICFCWELLFFCTMAFMLTHVHGKEQTGVCNLTDPAIIWDMSSIANPETIRLYPCSSTKPLQMTWMNSGILQGHLKVENLSPDTLRPWSSSRANVKAMVIVLAIIGGIGLAGRMLYKH